MPPVHPLPPHTCGTPEGGIPDDLRPDCPACSEGAQRILDALRVLGEPPGDCWDCAVCIVRIARLDNVEIEVTAKEPAVPIAWAPRALRCEHGTIFYHRPTITQRYRWASS